MSARAGQGRIDRPAPQTDHVHLPGTLGRRFLVFVDTEEEFDWSAPRRRDATSTAAVAALPEAHRRLSGFGICPTYLVDYPVASSPAAVDTLRPLQEAGECAIGAQLHPWVNPPFDEPLTVANSFVGNLPEEQERAKLAALTRLHHQCLRSSPAGLSRRTIRHRPQQRATAGGRGISHGRLGAFAVRLFGRGRARLLAPRRRGELGGAGRACCSNCR